MYNDYVNISCLVLFFICFCFISYYFYNSQIKQMREGMNNLSKTSHSINSNDYHEKIKIGHNSLKTKLNIPEYRTDYENVVIEMHDFIDGLMLDELLNIDSSNITNDQMIKTIHNMNKLSSGKDSLNKVMKYIDSN